MAAGNRLIHFVRQGGSQLSQVVDLPDACEIRLRPDAASPRALALFIRLLCRGDVITAPTNWVPPDSSLKA